MSEESEKPDRADTELRAMDLLARRDHSSGELRSKLLKKGFDSVHVDDVIDSLVERGWIDDTEFATRQSKILVRKTWGPLKIVQKLVKHGVDYDLANQVVDALDVSWVELARERLQSRFGASFDAEKAYRHLTYRGFDAQTARRAVFDDAT